MQYRRTIWQRSGLVLRGPRTRCIRNRIVGLWLAITLIRRCRPVGGLDGSFALHCVFRTHHSEANFLIQRVRGPRSKTTTMSAIVSGDLTGTVLTWMR